jgi:beta-lactamase regulating signal transducer with metallopeptidase domain/uncharacterized membrane protein YkoI
MITSSELLLTFLLNAVWQIGLITAAAAVCARLLRGGPARYLYLLWVATLALSVLLPVVTSASHLREVFLKRQPPANERPFVRELKIPLANPLDPAKSEAGMRSLTVPLGFNLAVGLIVLYFLGVFHRSGKLIAAGRRTRSLVGGARDLPLTDSVGEALEKCRAAIEVKKVSVLCSAAISAPVTVGNRRPLIILPEEMLRETDANILTTAIGHELAHIRRRDYLFNLIFELLFLPLSFHPAAALVKRRINQTRELCCDEMVAKRLLKADVYARSLVKIAGSASNLSRPALTITVGMTDAENLEVRIMSLLKKSELSFYRKTLLIVAALSLLAIPCVVAAFFVLNPGINSVAAQENLSREERQTIERKAKLEQELKERQNNPGEIPERKEKLEKEMVEREKLSGKIEERRVMEERALAERQEQSKLAKETKITMEQAIQSATNQQSGVVLSSNLGRANGEVVYRIFILDKDAVEGNGTLVIVSGLDGRVIKTEKGFL